MELDLKVPGVSVVSFNPEFKLSWKRVDQGSSEDDGESADSDSEDEETGGFETIDWGKSPRAKRWGRVNRPYHPGDGRRHR